jgi:carboxymethylenebutenolidase
MLKLTRPEGTPPEDLYATRRAIAPIFFAGYAAAAVSASAQAQTIHTDSVGLIAQDIFVPAPNQPIPAYMARPNTRGRYATIIVVPEVFGLHEYIRDVCRRLAKLGYAAIAPDPFFRAGNPAPLTDFAEIQRIVTRATNAQVMADLDAVGRWVDDQPFAQSNAFGITGFCWGGAVVWMALARFPGLKAGVAWYGRLKKPPAGQFLGDEVRPWPVDVVSGISQPILGLYGGRDTGIPVADVDEMNATLRRLGRRNSEIIVYPNAQHGFHADYRATYDAAAATDGWQKMLAHFQRAGLRPR